MCVCVDDLLAPLEAGGEEQVRAEEGETEVEPLKMATGPKLHFPAQTRLNRTGVSTSRVGHGANGALWVRGVAINIAPGQNRPFP